MLSGAELHVTEPQSFHWDEKSVEVHGITDSLTTSALQLTFENRKQSGGGTVTGIDRYEHVAVVHFRDSTGSAKIKIISYVIKKKRKMRLCQTGKTQPKNMHKSF